MRRKERKFRNKRFCMLEADLIESRAFEELSGKAAIVCLIRFHQKINRLGHRHRKGKLSNKVITNNGEIIFTYGEAKELGIKSSQTFNKVIHELVEDKGFIDIAEPGNWYERRPTKFGISYRWRDYGTPVYARLAISRSLPHGLGFQGGGKKEEERTTV